VKGLPREGLVIPGCSAKTIESWWYGQRRPALRVLSHLAEVLDVDVSYLHGEVATPYDSLTFRQVAARESLRLFLARDATLSQAERDLLHAARDSLAAPTTVERWQSLCGDFIKPAVAVGGAQATTMRRMTSRTRAKGERRLTSSE
jgi:hypothetical protein